MVRPAGSASTDCSMLEVLILFRNTAETVHGKNANAGVLCMCDLLRRRLAAILAARRCEASAAEASVIRIAAAASFAAVAPLTRPSQAPRNKRVEGSRTQRERGRQTPGNLSIVLSPLFVSLPCKMKEARERNPLFAPSLSAIRCCLLVTIVCLARPEKVFVRGLASCASDCCCCCAARSAAAMLVSALAALLCFQSFEANML